MSTDTAAFPLTAIDRAQLALKDEDFKLITWQESKAIIAEAETRLEELKRTPSDLRRYVAWTSDIKNRYGSITNYVCQEKLQWKPLRSDSHNGSDDPSTPRFAYANLTPFADPADYKILRNDWPYGFEPSITHLCVWLKNQIPSDDTIGDLTPASRQTVEDFINKTFVKRLNSEQTETSQNGYLETDSEEPRPAADRVLWFKNFVSLQSVRGIDHVHVLVRDVPSGIIDEWTSQKGS